MERQPKYPVYVPSKGRAHLGQTIKFLQHDHCPFYLVVEPQEAEEYQQRFPQAHLLVLPWSGNNEIKKEYAKKYNSEVPGVTPARNWIRDHAEAHGHAKHWQLDDNIQQIKRRYYGKRIPCRAGLALRVTEDFVDRYENIGVAGLNYEMFLPNGKVFPPYYRNVHVYSCSLINHTIPYHWRPAYNEDTDLCLQVLSGGWCTLLMNAFFVYKIRTEKMTGGNTTDLYQGDGRLKMARSLERMWPGVVTTQRRFQRPQHVVRNAWRGFDTPLIRRTDIDWSQLTEAPDEHGMELVQVKPEVKSPALRELVAEYQSKKTAK